MLADAEYFNSRLSKLEGAGDLGSRIVETVKSKTIVPDTRQSQSRSPEKGDTLHQKEPEKTAKANGEPEET